MSFLVAAASPQTSRAASPDGAPAVVVVGDAGDPLKVRVVAELRAAGLRVVSVEPGPEPDAGGEATTWAFAAGATSALVLGREAPEATILVMRSGARRPAVSGVLPASGDPGLAALQITEAVRAAVRTAEEAAEPAEPSVPAAARPPEPREAASAPSGRRPTAQWGGSLGPAVASGFAGFGPSAAALATVHWESPARWGIEALCAAPLSSEQWSGVAGRASLTFGLATLGARWEAQPGAWGSVDAGVSVGPAVAHTTGQAATGYVAVERTTWVVAPTIRVGATVRLGRSWRARLDLATAVVFPRVAYTSPTDGPSNWGRPLALAALSLEGISE
jgi:hypothetical protein